MANHVADDAKSIFFNLGLDCMGDVSDAVADGGLGNSEAKRFLGNAQ